MCMCAQCAIQQVQPITSPGAQVIIQALTALITSSIMIYYEDSISVSGKLIKHF